MTRESTLVHEIWETVRDALPKIKGQDDKRQDVATSMLKSFADYGMDSAELHDLLDEDSYLRKAFSDVFGEDEEQEDEEDEEDY